MLNGYSKLNKILYWILKYLHLLKFVRKRYGLFGIRTHKVKLLSKIVKQTNAKIVLSSSWRYTWYKSYKEKSNIQKSLEDKLNKYNIEVIGITPMDMKGRRENEILSYLKQHSKEIESYVILDDERFNFDKLFHSRLILTSESIDIKGEWSESLGLKRKHIKQAIKILNTPIAHIALTCTK